jgi:pyoverdine/dityrosine biosynthesis protein Dit1
LKIKKINSKTAKAGIIAALITAAAGLVFVVLTQVNFLGDLVVDQIRKAVNDKLGIELVMPALSATPWSASKEKKCPLSVPMKNS